MKRTLAIILAFMIIIGCNAFAESAIDFASMTDEQLHEIIDSARNELTKRELNMAEDVVLFEQDGVTLYLTGNYKTWGSDNVYLDMEAVIINDSDKTVSILVDSASINGWEVYGRGFSDTSAGKKQKGNLEFSISEAEISTYEEVEDIELTITIYDGENWETISVVENIVIHCN